MDRTKIKPFVHAIVSLAKHCQRNCRDNPKTVAHFRLLCAVSEFAISLRQLTLGFPFISFR